MDENNNQFPGGMRRIVPVAGVLILAVILACAIALHKKSMPVASSGVPSAPIITVPSVLPASPRTERTTPAAVPSVPGASRAVHAPPRLPLLLPGMVAPQTTAALQTGRLAGALKLSSPVVAKGGRLPLDYTCYRANISPAVTWQGAPAGTKSFVLFMERQEKDKAPFVNWIVFNIPARVTSLPSKMPKQPAVYTDGTMQARNDYNLAAYAGPCDPKGSFTYVLRLFALDTILNLTGGVAKDNLIGAMNGHIIDEGDLPVTHYFRF